MKTEIQSIHKYCLKKKGTSESYPFGEGVLVYKVLDKMFALITEETDPLVLKLKCDPEDSEALRTQYQAITPADHMNKKHWIDLLLDGSLSPSLVFELIDHSYDLVVKKMRKSDQDKLIG